MSDWPHGQASHLTPDERRTVRWVTDQYGKFSASQLSVMTHNELPWRAARGGLPESANSSAKISTDLMRTYYARQIADSETAVGLATANAALEGAEFDQNWQDKLRDVAAGVVSADDLISEEIARLKGD